MTISEIATSSLEIGLAVEESPEATSDDRVVVDEQEPKGSPA
jgi:hypothetical protein